MERVVVAEILRPRGNRGELVAKSQTDVPGRLETLKRAQAQLADGTDVAIEVENAWPHKGDWILKFAGVDSIDSAERFRGADLWLSPAERPALAPGEFFQSDLVGCELVDRATGKRLGVVDGWEQYGSAPLMRVTVSGHEILVPFVRDMCDVDLPDRTVRVNLPEGLLDL